MTEREKDGSGLYKLGPARWIGVDRAAGGDQHTECEMERLPDGTIKILDIRHYPPTPAD